MKGGGGPPPRRHRGPRSHPGRHDHGAGSPRPRGSSSRRAPCVYSQRRDAAGARAGGAAGGTGPQPPLGGTRASATASSHADACPCPLSSRQEGAFPASSDQLTSMTLSLFPFLRPVSRSAPTVPPPWFPGGVPQGNTTQRAGPLPSVTHLPSPGRT